MYGEKIKDLREKKGETQAQTAFALNVARQTLSNWETETNAPNFDMLVKIADYFGVSVDTLIRKNKQLEKSLKDINIDTASVEDDRQKDIKSIAYQLLFFFESNTNYNGDKWELEHINDYLISDILKLINTYKKALNSYKLIEFNSVDTFLKLTDIIAGFVAESLTTTEENTKRVKTMLCIDAEKEFQKFLKFNGLKNNAITQSHYEENIIHTAEKNFNNTSTKGDK